MPLVSIDTVDVIEINHCRGQFTQLIFWDLDSEGEYRVRAWRIIRPLPLVYRERADSRVWVVRWRDGQSGVRRAVRAPVRRESWTDHDPEIDDRAILPVSQRAGLR